jgi:hypothetical protein
MIRSAELQAMYEAKAKLQRVIQLQEKVEFGLIEADSTIYDLTQQQKDNYLAAITSEKITLINELIAMMNAYLTQ